MPGKASQDFVPIREIRDGIIIMKDGTLRAVMMCSSVNIALKSGDEQQAILMQFQNFLNTIDFDVQIVIQSRKRDLRTYIDKLEERMKEQKEPLLKIQTREYIQFIKTLTEEVNVMTKHFFVVVPYGSPSIAQKGGLLDKLIPKKSSEEDDNKKKFEEDRSQLEQRTSIVEQGLARVGVRAVLMNTAEVTELFYKSFNPGATGSINAFATQES